MSDEEFRMFAHYRDQLIWLASLDDMDEMKAGEDDAQTEFNILVSLFERVYGKDIKTLEWEYNERKSR